MRRHKIGRSKSRKHFSNNAGTHSRNLPHGMPMRGGIRL